MGLLLVHSGRYSNYEHLNKNCQHQVQIKCVTIKILHVLYYSYFPHNSITIYNFYDRQTGKVEGGGLQSAICLCYLPTYT